MRVEFINPFLSSTISAFDTMLQCQLKRGDLFAKENHNPENEVSGIIGLSGKAQGTVVLGLNREAALSATEVMLLERPTKINGEVTDAVGELANIIAGGAKAKLEHLQLSVSLPTVITGKHYCVDFPSKVTPICIPFDSAWGPITVEVGISEPAQ
ncbi:MAG: chemotaxis protein CheX [bacterium]